MSGTDSTSTGLEDRYQIVRILGTGGTGTVHLARDLRLDRLVALKLLHPHILQIGELRGRFGREARLFRHLDHPHLVKVLDVDLSRTPPYITFEYVDGATPLADLLAGPKTRPYQPHQLLTQLASALAHLHDRGVIHRDIKPANILVDARGSPKLIDLGFARSLSADETRLTREGQVMGTLSYMAPEQIRGEEATPATDLYAFGLVALEVLAARPIFSTHAAKPISPILRLTSQQPPARQLLPELPAPWGTIIERCLRERGTPLENGAALESLIRQTGSEQTGSDHSLARHLLPQPARRPPPPRWSRSLPVAWALGLVTLVSLSTRHHPSPSTQSPSPTISTEDLWSALESLDPDYVARRLQEALKNSARNPANPSKVWEEHIPDVLRAPAYRDSLRREIEEAEGDPSLMVLERLTHLEALFQALRGPHFSSTVNPTQLLPETYREGILTLRMMERLIGDRKPPFWRGKLIKSTKPAPDQLLESGEKDSILQVFEDGGQYRAVEIFEIGGSKSSKPLEETLGIRNDRRQAELPSRWVYHVDFLDDSRHLKSKFFIFGVYCDDLVGSRLRININSRLTIFLSLPPVPVSDDDTSKKGHRLHFRRLPSHALKEGKNTFTVGLLPPLEPSDGNAVWIGSLHLRTCPGPGD